jgi:hypothetical protein
MVRLSWLLLVAAMGLGCFDDQVGVDDIVSCRNDDDCPNVLTCIAAECRRADLPVPPNLEITTNEDVPIDIELGLASVRGLAVTLVQVPESGQVLTTENIVVDGIAQYQPGAHAAGRDSFTYRWTINGADAGTGTVIITIVPQNDPPQITLLLDEEGTLVPTTTLTIDEGTAMPFFIAATDVEGVEGRLPPGEGVGHYRVIDGEAGPCHFEVTNLIADVWEARAPNDDACPTPALTSTLDIVATDADGLQVTTTVPMVRAPINDAPANPVVELTCLGEVTPLGACRNGARVSARADDIDGDELCVTLTATDEFGQSQPISAAPCAPTGTLQPLAGVAIIEVVARLCDPTGSCVEASAESSFVTTSRDCATLKNANPALPSGSYVIDPLGDGQGFEAFCNMTFNQGGYTLALKIDGRSTVFGYGDLGANVWTSDTFDTEGINEQALQVKLQPYLSVPLTEVLMAVDDQLAQPILSFDHTVVVDAFASPSLQQLVTGPSQFVDEDFTRWQLFPNTTFQCGCNRLVANAAGLRLGLLLDEDIDASGNPTTRCNDPDSFVGIGGNCFGGPGGAGNCSAANFFDDCPQQGVRSDVYRPWFAWVFVRSTDFTDQPSAASCDAHALAGRSLSGRYRLSDDSIVDCSFP